VSCGMIRGATQCAEVIPTLSYTATSNSATGGKVTGT
jgi:hypothetical protein